ncbi:cyclin domain protein F-box protein [Candidatus Amoebophilus asiaticus 5a2]|uniref:Cyclin domain protein F-box protein n=1 Tax=Amoebophilus asiaticus (strain 5a2) TaxID=452471 RepID=B3EUE1_AMOA5|nr:F-box protein [Candidatus Amoebophilus asiaticus]ACE05560.1 cyclin domain protein F-box protein [Candidatus Amoebophilus asiaticus 5a2]
MKKAYSVAQQYINYVLFVSLFLQSCCGLNNPLIPIRKEQTAPIRTDVQELIPQINIESLIGQELIAQGEHIVTFYKEAGKVKANVKINAPKGFSKFHVGAEVLLEKEAECMNLSRLNKQAQLRRIHFQSGQVGQPAKVIIYKNAGLMGGGNIIVKQQSNPDEEEDYEDEETEEQTTEEEREHKGKREEEVKTDGKIQKQTSVIFKPRRGYQEEATLQADSNTGSYQALLTAAINGNVEAQLQLAQKSYQETLICLHKAVVQDYRGATMLLKKIKLSNIGQEAQEREIPIEIWGRILSHVPLEDIFSARLVNHLFYELITGDRSIGMIGLKNKLKPIAHGYRCAIDKIIHFRSDKLVKLTPQTIPSFPFYCLMRHVTDLPVAFYPHLKDTDIHTLELRNKAGAKRAIELARALQGTQVHTLNLRFNEIGAEGAIEVAKALQGTQVHTLDLVYNQIGAEGAIEVAKALQGTQVHKLDLSNNQIGAEGAIEVAKALQGTQVHTLNLMGNQIGNEGAIELAKALQGTQVHTLYLRRNQIDNEGAIEVAKALQGAQVHTLSLSDNQIGAEGVIELANALQGTQVHTLYLSHNQIGNEGAIGLAKALQGAQVYTLDLSHNQIDNEGAIGLAKALQGTQVHKLDLSHNQIDNEGAIGLAKALQGTQVHKLDLSHSKIDNEGAIGLAKALQGTQVHTLNLMINEIGNEGAIGLAKALQGTQVHTLDLMANAIGNEGAIGLAKALQGTQVHTLGLSANQIGNATKQLLVEQYPHIKWKF